MIESGEWIGVISEDCCPVLTAYWSSPGYFQREIDLTQDLDDYIRLLLQARRLLRERNIATPRTNVVDVDNNT